MPTREKLAYYLQHPSELLRRAANEIDGFYPRAVPYSEPEKLFQIALFFRESGLIKPGDLVFDIGANIGTLTWVFLAAGAEVVSVEPNPKCVNYLRRTYARNLHHRIVASGLASQPGNLTLHYYPDRSEFGAFETTPSIAGPRSRRLRITRNVPVVTFDQLIKDYGIPAFAKIDVEGFELEVLQGLSQPIPTLSLEYHIDTLDTTRKCLTHLKSLGEYRFNFCYRAIYEFCISDWLEVDAVLSAMEARRPNDPKTWGDLYARLV